MFNTKEKRERALGIKLFLKPHRCSSPKCATIRKPQPPGMHVKGRRGSVSEFGTQLREKQKIKAMYGLREAAMRRIFSAAAKAAGATGEGVMALLERRLDNVVYRLGLALSRSVARQLVGHGHIIVNGKRVKTPSFLVRPGDTIAIRAASKDHPVFKELSEQLKTYEAPVWLTLDKTTLIGKVKAAPKDVDTQFDTNLVVDYYSK
ncbi:MAG: 30S ribosomal protein S4 [Candidatus Harrisonbacteria bacterium]|nr:30S ribosomal protein S4 [Candidatus Harrisonbacteria bacterium]